MKLSANFEKIFWRFQLSSRFVVFMLRTKSQMALDVDGKEMPNAIMRTVWFFASVESPFHWLLYNYCNLWVVRFPRITTTGLHKERKYGFSYFCTGSRNV